MKVVLGLGSNLGAPAYNIKQAIKAIKAADIKVIAYSSVYRSEALLTPDAPNAWNLPFLNAAILIETSLAPHALLKLIKKIETQIGRNPTHAKWSPREIDIDILMTESETTNQPDLTIPHKELYNRHFALAPLLEIYPLDEKATSICKQLPTSQKINLKLTGPLMMGICNLTYDSYTESGSGIKPIKNSFDQIKKLVEDGADIIDIGAESTRPDAIAMSADNEIKLLIDLLDYLIQHQSQLTYMPLISIDTRKLEVMQAVLNKHPWIWMINDVEGNDLEQKAKLINAHATNYVLTHNLGIINRQDYLDKTNVTQHILNYFTNKLSILKNHGVDLSKLYLDVGFGFGKKADTAQQILADLTHIRKTLNLPLLIGHSRKPSVLGLPKNSNITKLDQETMRLSTWLVQQGVDILRVHLI